MDEARFRESEQALWSSVGLQPTERFLPLARVGCRVRVQEVGDGPVVLFVHGATNAGASWSGLVRDLDGYRCVTPRPTGVRAQRTAAPPPRRPHRARRVHRVGAGGRARRARAWTARTWSATSYGGYLRAAHGGGAPGAGGQVAAARLAVRRDRAAALGTDRAASPRSVGSCGVIPQNERTVRALLEADRAAGRGRVRPLRPGDARLVHVAAARHRHAAQRDVGRTAVPDRAHGRPGSSRRSCWTGSACRCTCSGVTTIRWGSRRGARVQRAPPGRRAGAGARGGSCPLDRRTGTRRGSGPGVSRCRVTRYC